MIKKYERIVCWDGFSMSVQASEFAYCSPRDNEGAYIKVEVGYPSEQDDLLMPHIEWDYEYNEDADDAMFQPVSNPTQTVYPYTPVGVVLAVIDNHGGMVSGELPPFKIDEEE